MKELLEPILPTKLTRWLSSVTAMLLVSVMTLPDLLQKAGFSPKWQPSTEYRLALLSLIWLIGSLLLIASLIYEFNQREKLHKAEIEKLKQASSPREERKLRIQKWRDELESCNKSIKDFYLKPTYTELRELMTDEQKRRVDSVFSKYQLYKVTYKGPDEINTEYREFYVFRSVILEIEQRWGLL